jgi:hypothetical protein
MKLMPNQTNYDHLQTIGFYQTPDISKGFTVDSAYVRKVAIDAARGGMVLLKNEGNILPYRKINLNQWP